jgi:hypothetical protein
MRDSGVFVCGSPYAETNTIAWALAQHARFWTSPESRFLFSLFGRSEGLPVPYLFHQYQLASADGAWLAANSVSYPEFASAIGFGIARLLASRAGGRRWIDSSPENALMIDTLLLMFPTAVFVGVVQSPENARCTVLESANEIGGEEIAAVAEHYREVLSQAAFHHPDRVFLVDQEEMIADPERLFDEMLDFLGEERNPGVGAFFCKRLFKMGCDIEEARARLRRAGNSNSPTAGSPLRRRPGSAPQFA